MDYSSRYNFLIRYKGGEELINRAFADRCLYIRLLTNIYELLNLRSDYIEIKTGNGLIIENNVDLMLIFDIYKENLRIPLVVTLRH